VNLTRDQLFAGAGLARNQHGEIRLRDEGDLVPQPRDRRASWVAGWLGSYVA